MRAVTYQGRRNVQVEERPDPRVEDARDAVVNVKATAICGSDLHLYHGLVPGLKRGEILGHEAIGIVRELAENVPNVVEGDRVVIPFPIAEGHCVNCRRGLYAQCLETNDGPSSAIFGYSHRYGGIDGTQADAVRVPYADVGLHKLPDNVSDDAAVFLADVLPTGYQAVAQAGVGSAGPTNDPRTQGRAAESEPPEETVAVYGAGPVGLMAIHTAKRLLGARKVIAIDRIEKRLDLARDMGADVVVNFEEDDKPVERVQDETDRLGADVTVDAVGFEASSPGRVVSAVEKAAGAVMLQTGNLTALRWAFESVRKGGTVSVPGVYAVAPAQMFPWGPTWEKGVRILTGQTHVQAYLPELIDKVADGTLDPARIVTHHASLDDAPEMYRTFEKKEDECVKVVLKP